MNPFEPWLLMLLHSLSRNPLAWVMFVVFALGAWGAFATGSPALGVLLAFGALGCAWVDVQPPPR